MTPSKCLICILALCALWSSCTNESVAWTFHDSSIKGDSTSHQLCFDLTSESRIVGAILPKAEVEKIDRITLLLPFETNKIFFNDQLVNTNSSRNGYTIIDFLASPEKQWITFYPSYLEKKKGNGGIFWIKEGLTREFTIDFGKIYPNDALNKCIDSVSILNILLPANAEIFRNECAPINQTGDSYKFDLASIRNGSKKVFTIKYMVEAADLQKDLVAFLIKLAGILMIPFVQFIFLEKEPTNSKKIRIKKITIWITLILQALIFVIVGYLGVLQFLNTGESPLFELALLLVGIVSEALVLWMKK